MNREQLLKRIESRWDDLRAAYAGLSEAELTEPGVVEGWSVKDILAHVTTWEEEALRYLPLIAQGSRPPKYITYGGLDAFNAMMTEKKRDLALPEVLGQMEATHQRLLDYLATVPEERIKTETRFRHRLRWDTYSHYPLHSEAIREWRARRVP